MPARVFVIAALSGPLPKAGVIALALLVATLLLAPARRLRAVGVLGVLALAPVLLLADIWHSPQLSIVHRHPAEAAIGGAVIVALALGAAVFVRRRPTLTAPVIIGALPFRVPIQAGGTTSNLLVPLYAVVAVAALAEVMAAFGGDPEGAAPLHSAPRPVVWLERLLALTVVLYAAQSIYSPDFEKALQQMVFFYAPFAVVFAQLRRLPWSETLLRRCLQVVAAEAIVFAAIGFAEYATKTIILNPKLVVQNDLHAYFTVNSVFFDPDIFGRFLALVMIALVAALLYARRRGEQLIITAVLAVLWAGLVLTLSRSSLGALLLGLATLAALRWRPGRALILGAVVVAIGAIAVVASPRTFGLNQGLNGASSGRASLVGGGVHMFGQRPLWGWGSASFVVQYQREHRGTDTTLAASHTIAVTIAAEQGLIGEIVYIALVLVGLLALLHGARGDPARAALAAAFLALVLHTNLYADFLEDPVTWTVLGVGAALAAAARAPEAARRRIVGAAAARG